MANLIIVIFVTLLLCKSCMPSAIGGHQESLREKEALNNVNEKSIAQVNHSSDLVNENKNALTENKNDHYVGAVDNGGYVNQDVSKKIFDDNKFVGGHDFKHDAGETSDGSSMKKAHKKGHHHQGFRNSYHKDESSNNSSYFDDYLDENDQSNARRGSGRYDKQSDDRYSTRKEDGEQRLNDYSRKGNYDRRGATEGKNLDHYDYNRKRYDDDRRDQSHQYRGQDYAERDRGVVHAEGSGPRYPYPPPLHPRPEYPPHPRPYHEYARRDYYAEPRYPPPPVLRRHEYPSETRRETITIYEDPRIVNPYSGVGSLRADDSDLIRLDVRPGGHRYQRYDSYYDRRDDLGVNRRSDINPLVFNYKRY